MQKLAILVGLVLFSSLTAAAQDSSSKIDIFAGYSFVHTVPGASLSSFNANGGVASVALNFNSWFSGCSKRAVFIPPELAARTWTPLPKPSWPALRFRYSAGLGFHHSVKSCLDLSTPIPDTANKQSIAIRLPRPPESELTGMRLATSESGSPRWTTCLRACPRLWAR
jgi:hypothetical protein